MPLLPVEGGIDRIARIAQRRYELPVEIWIVFHDEKPHYPPEALVAPQFLLRLAGQSVNGDVGDVALGPEHDEFVEKPAVLIAKARMNDLSARARLHYLVNDIGRQRGIFRDHRGRRSPGQAVWFGGLPGCGQQEADDSRDSRLFDEPPHGFQVPLFVIDRVTLLEPA